MARAPGLSVRLKLTLSYAGFLMLAGVLLLAAVWLYLLRFVPDRALLVNDDALTSGVFPVRSNLLHTFAPAAAIVMAVLLAFGLVGGWLLAGRMLAPLSQISEAARLAANGSLSHRIALAGRNDEFRELADTFDDMLARLEAHVAEQRRFAANASHELRTPLAITRALLDVARNDPNRDRDELVERLHARQRPSDRPHRSTARAQPRRPALVHPGAGRPVTRRRRSRRDAPLSRPRNEASPSRPPAT